MEKVYLPPAIQQDPQEAAAKLFNEQAVAPSTAVFDNGRRGNPLIGCDCAQCFGYCMIDGDDRERILRAHAEESQRNRLEETYP